MQKNEQHISAWSALCWILCLAALSVGAKNFEMGFSVDAPLWATIARNIARTGEWFRLDGFVPDFVPVAEHPHLGMWLMALIFKLLPPADWSARIVGHLFYVGFLWGFFLYIRQVSGQKIAIWTVLILWIWTRFAAYFSSAYLDPGLLFFGSASIALWHLSFLKERPLLSLFSGVALALAFMVKGLAICGFLPALLVITLFCVRNKKEVNHLIKSLGLFVLGLSVVLIPYIIAIRQSTVPDFFSIYFSRQFSNRFGQSWELGNIFYWDYWLLLLRDSHYLAPLAFFSILKWREGIKIWLPTTLALTFLIMYAGARLLAHQYWITVLPWLAWLIAEGLFSRIPKNPTFLVKASAVLSLVLLFLIQYTPIQVHQVGVPPEIGDILLAKKEKSINQLMLDASPMKAHFGLSSVYTWYADLRTSYADPGKVPTPQNKALLLLYHHDLDRIAALKQAGWCPYKMAPKSLWLACD